MRCKISTGGPGKSGHVLAVLVALAGLLPVPAEAGPRHRRGKPKLRALSRHADANTALGLKASTLVTLDLVRTPDGRVTTIVPVDGVLCTLELRPHSVRAKGFRVRTQLADGSLVPVKPGRCCTLRGSIPEIPGSVVAASLSPDGLSARILLPDGTSHWIEPLRSRVLGAGPDDHVVYSHKDVIPQGGTCLATAASTHEGFITDSAVSSAVGAAAGLSTAELAIDADSEFVAFFADEEAAVADIEGIINAVNIVYERDVAISHVITEIILRTPGSDPYTTTIPRELLCEFRTQWNSLPESDIQRDAAHLFTGKDLDLNTVGIAFVGAMCNFNGFGIPECPEVDNQAYGLSQSRYTANLDERVALTAHELGHNWNAPHCDGDTISPFRPDNPGCHIMCSSINGCNGVEGADLKFAPRAKNIIRPFRDDASCLLFDPLLSFTIGSPTDSLDEDSTLQFSAATNFLLAGTEDVTTTVTWSVDPPTAGTISAAGLFTPADVVGDTCHQISATFTLDSLFTDSKLSLVRDLDTIRSITDSFPPDGAINATQTSPPAGTPAQGWTSIELTFNGDTCLMTAGSLEIIESDGAVPTVDLFEWVPPRTVRITLRDPITPGVWTTFTEIESGASVRMAALPSDINSDGTVGPEDITALQDALRGLGAPLDIWSADIDLSGRLTPADILRAIDLQTGDDYDVWSGRTLPP